MEEQTVTFYNGNTQVPGLNSGLNSEVENSGDAQYNAQPSPTTPRKMVMISDRPGTSSSRRPGTSSSRPGTSGGRKKKSELRKMFDQQSLPVLIEERGLGKKLKWTVDIETLNYGHILPIFFAGIQEKEDPYRFVAFEGVFELLESAACQKADLVPILPQIVKAIKQALNTRDPGIVYATLKVMQQLAVCEGVGIALANHYRQILPVCNILKDKHLGSGRSSISDAIQETLELLEAYGGEEAYENIKRMVPTYESCLQPPPREAA